MSACMPSLSRSLEAQMPIEGLDCGERGHALLHMSSLTLGLHHWSPHRQDTDKWGGLQPPPTSTTVTLSRPQQPTRVLVFGSFHMPLKHRKTHLSHCVCYHDWLFIWRNNHSKSPKRKTLEVNIWKKRKCGWTIFNLRRLLNNHLTKITMPTAAGSCSFTKALGNSPHVFKIQELVFP